MRYQSVLEVPYLVASTESIRHEQVKWTRPTHCCSDFGVHCLAGGAEAGESPLRLLAAVRLLLLASECSGGVWRSKPRDCLLKAGIPAVEVAEAEKPRLLQPMGISADYLHYFNKEIKHYLHSDLLNPW